MADGSNWDKINRRDFTLGAGAAVALATTIAVPSQAQAKPTLQELVTKLSGGVTPTAGKIKLKLPEVANDGSSVPVTIEVDSPMTDQDYVKAFHVIAPANPTPHIFTFTFTPQSGRAKTSSRMRLAATQEVTILAQLSNGTVLTTKKAIKVLAGGCN